MINPTAPRAFSAERLCVDKAAVRWAYVVGEGNLIVFLALGCGGAQS